MSALFYLYLAWWNSAVYGEFMYAIAAGGFVFRTALYGLYYPSVYDLGRAEEASKPAIINRINVIRSILLVLSMSVVSGLILWMGFPAQMAGIVFLIALGHGLEALSETFFADLRVRGQQDVEARIRMAGSILGYGFGLVGIAVGLPPVIVALYKAVQGLVRIVYGAVSHLQRYVTHLFFKPDWGVTWEVVRSATLFALIDILGVIYNKANIFFLERATGVEGVARYSATYNIVDPVCTLGSEQLLGMVIFPMLSTLWWKDRVEAARLVRRTAQWLLAIALPIMFFLAAESELIIGILYPGQYKDAAWMQKYLIWTILISFGNNLFSYVMMVAGAVRILFAFTAITAVLNLVFNVALVGPFGLAGGCLVLIFTKLSSAVLTLVYCQMRFGLFKPKDFAFPLLTGAASIMIYYLIEPVTGFRPALTVAIGLYLVLLWKPGMRFLGRFPGKTAGQSADKKP